MEATETPTDATRTTRLVGRLRGASPGRMIIVVTAIHGNEPAGLDAARRLLAALAPRERELRGDLVVFAGNVRALATGKRYLERDLNRQWTDEKVISLRGDASAPDDRHAWRAEDYEQLELLTALEGAAGEARGEVIFLDLHTTSADGVPFAMIGDNLQNRGFALRFPLAIILGLEELVDGPLLEYMSDRGYVTLGIEGGQHTTAASVDHLEDSLWIALVAAGLLDRDAVADFDARRARLAATRGNLPHVMEVLHRHAITAEDAFVMMPGFANIQRVQAGDILARDRRGDIRAITDGIVFLPLYQAQGDDGFFIGREVPGWWLRLSAALRGLHAGRAIGLLPGVRRDPTRRRAMIVDARFMRWYPLWILNLFGFRQVRAEQGRYLINRRRQDDAG